MEITQPSSLNVTSHGEVKVATTTALFVEYMPVVLMSELTAIIASMSLQVTGNSCC